MIFELAITFLHGFGFYLLLKRKAYGFLLIIITSFIFWFIRDNVMSIYYLITILVLFAPPWVATYFEIQNKNKT